MRYFAKIKHFFQRFISYCVLFSEIQAYQKYQREMAQINQRRTRRVCEFKVLIPQFAQSNLVLTQQQEDEQRKKAGLSALPDDQSIVVCLTRLAFSHNLKLLLCVVQEPQAPSMLDSLIVTSQVDHYCKQLSQVCGFV